MDYWTLIYILPAVFSLAVIAANAMPFERSSRHNTLLIFLAGMAVLNVPQEVQVALALCLPVAYLHKFFGISLSGIGAADYKVRQTVSVVKEHLTRPKIRAFLTRSYPNPEMEPVEELEPATLTQVRKFVPEL
jgi:hypothetical protein